MYRTFSKIQAATSIAIFFHLVGLVGILFIDQEQFTRYTPVNLMISFLLLVWTQREKNIHFLYFLSFVILFGFSVELTGIHTGWIFGDYNYGNVLGPLWFSVPLIIGINWVIIIYCCGISTHNLFTRAVRKLEEGSRPVSRGIKGLSVIVDGAILAVAFDWLMEPVAVKLGFWTWHGDGAIPLSNYFTWFVVSALMLTVFHFLRFKKQNKFAINLLLVQALFFLLLRTFLK